MKETAQSNATARGRGFLLLCLFLVALVTFTAGAVQAQQERGIENRGPIGYGERVIGPLTPDLVAQVWQFEGRQGDEIAVAMNALTEELDPFVLLLATGEADLQELFTLSSEELGHLDAVTAERGLLLELNDDGGDDTNALIPSFVLPADGPYAIVATSCCTGESSGRYELVLDLLGQQEPDGSGPLPPQLQGYTPGEGQAGTELVMTLQGEGLSTLGDPADVIVGNVEIPVLDFAVIDDQTLQMGLFLPPETPAGEHEIQFFFENGSLDGPFLVFGPDEEGPPDVVPPPPDEAPPPPDEAPPPPETGPGGNVPQPAPPWPLIGAILLVVALGGAVVWRRLRRPPSQPQARQQPPQSPPPDVRFKLQRDQGRQTVDSGGRSLRAGIDVRFKLRLEQSRQAVDENQTLLDR